MSTTYLPISWNRFKKQYDIILWSVIVLYLGIFTGFTILNHPAQNINTTLIRAFGTLAILLLHLILAVGPLSRISARLLPLLYNRRHLGVSMFIIASVHSLLSLLQFHGHGNIHPLLSLFTSNLHYDSLVFFPFQTLGFFALLILAAMAFTSHDFWLHFLGPAFWKTMHMLVYIAYGLILMHVALGIIQFEKSPVLVALLAVGFFVVAGLHVWTAVKENKDDEKQIEESDPEWEYVGDVEEIEDNKAKVVNIHKERVAIFKYDGKLSAVHNVCKHQMGPLGEGKVVDGCITCPWHGYQYRPEDGCAPKPFSEKVATYQLRLRGNRIFIHTAALPEGTFIEPLRIKENAQKLQFSNFFIGWAENNKALFTPTKSAVIIAGVCMLFVGVLLSTRQQTLSGFTIDYDNVKKVEGWLSVKPVPNLKIVNGKDGYGNPVYTTILLMDAFKFGADSVVKKALDGDSVKYVRLTGYLSSNRIACSDSSEDCAQICSQCIIGTTDNPVMEIDNGLYAFEAIQEPVAAISNVTNKGVKTLRGEIIDPKCYFGAMNPGQGKPHLSCAARCISGGIMPVLRYQVNNHNKYAVLTGLNGERINSEVLNFIGVPVQVKGNLSTLDNWGILKIDTKIDLRLLNKY